MGIKQASVKVDAKAECKVTFFCSVSDCSATAATTQELHVLDDVEYAVVISSPGPIIQLPDNWTVQYHRVYCPGHPPAGWERVGRIHE